MFTLYRAKEHKKEKWVKGYYFYSDYRKKHYLVSEKTIPFKGVEEKYTQIEPKTLSIHFDYMKDADGKKIFASLNKEGVGGDILSYNKTNAYCFYDKETSSIYLSNWGSHIREIEFCSFRKNGKKQQ